MDKLDLTKDLKPLYAPPRGKFVIVDVPRLNFLMVDGEGSPEKAPFGQAMEALYAVAYTAKFQLKLGPQKIDFRVTPLEGLWWADDMGDFITGQKDKWKWTLMIAMPNVVTAKVITEAGAKVTQKKQLAALGLLRLESFHEGKSAQTLYVGPYDDEAPTISAMHRFIEDAGHTLQGRHHEIYVSDPRRTDPAKLKTILRQPFA